MGERKSVSSHISNVLCEEQDVQVEREVKVYKELCESINITPIDRSSSFELFQYYDALSEVTLDERIAIAVNVLLKVIEQAKQHVDRVDKGLLDFHIARIDSKISEQLDKILHDSVFQSIESAWRGLKFLVDHTNFRYGVTIELLDVSKEVLRQDFEEAHELIHSGLYYQTYTQEYDTPGGEPIGVIISDFEFGRDSQDILLLNRISEVAAAAHMPFIGSVGAAFFGKDSMEEVGAIQDLSAYVDRAEYIKWNRFRETDNARYVGLVLPRFLARLPYGKDSVATRDFNYCERVGEEGLHHYLWANASFLFATNLVRSFVNHGWCVQIRGPQAGGLVEGLPIYFYDLGTGSQAKIPTEVLIPESREFDFANLGFIPLSFYKNKDYACFFSANSAQKPARYQTEEATANSRINARLPYIFLLSRIAHYLKLIQRENIGMIKEGRVLELELNNWLKMFVTEMTDPGEELQVSHPLRDAKVIIENKEDDPGFFCLKLFIVPHFQIEGVDINLSLVSQLPRAKG